jgi:flagellar basal-body rod modification protein FlgD
MTTTSSVASTTATTSTTTTDRTSLATNFQTFLTLLTTQLQNQDPTSPMDSNEFTQQLVMYSQVEQQIDTNDKLDSLISLGSNQSTSLAMSYLGKSVVISDGSGQLSDGAATWTYGLASDAAATTLTIKNSSGTVVYSTSGETDSGTHTFNWDGNTAAGDAQSDGLYTMTVTSTGSDGKSVTTTVASQATVSGVDLSGSTPQLVIGSSEVALSSVTMVTE